LQCRPEVALQTQDETNDVQSSQVGDEGEKRHVEHCRLLVNQLRADVSSKHPKNASLRSIGELHYNKSQNEINDVDRTEQNRQNPKSKIKLRML
jgi:hypothetical protein